MIMITIQDNDELILGLGERADTFLAKDLASRCASIRKVVKKDQERSLLGKSDILFCYSFCS